MFTNCFNASPYLRVMSIDPGTKTLGLAVWEVDQRTNERVILFAHTVMTDRQMSYYPWLVDNHSEKTARLKAIEDELLFFMCEWDVHVVATEGPYFRRMVTAFQALVECVTAIRAALVRYDPYMQLYIFDPASVKKSVGVGGNSGDKELMRQAVIQHFGNMVAPGVDLYEISEHAIDAIAVGNACINQL